MRFAADLDWLRQRGVAVDRYNLSQKPHAFVDNPVVKNSLREGRGKCLPLILIDGNVIGPCQRPGRS